MEILRAVDVSPGKGDPVHRVVVETSLGSVLCVWTEDSRDIDFCDIETWSGGPPVWWAEEMKARPESAWLIGEKAMAASPDFDDADIEDGPPVKFVKPKERVWVLGSAPTDIGDLTAAEEALESLDSVHWSLDGARKAALERVNRELDENDETQERYAEKPRPMTHPALVAKNQVELEPEWACTDAWEGEADVNERDGAVGRRWVWEVEELGVTLAILGIEVSP